MSCGRQERNSEWRPVAGGGSGRTPVRTLAASGLCARCSSRIKAVPDRNVQGEPVSTQIRLMAGLPGGHH